MKIKSEALKEVLMNYVEGLFAQFSQGWENMINKVAVKMLISNRFNELAPLFDKDGNMNVDDLEAFLLPEVKKLGVIEIKGLNKQFNFKEDDFIKLFAQIKSRSTND
jgi:hypothetical protein